MRATYVDAILTTPIQLPPATAEGRSREGRPLPAYQLGHGPRRISLIGGCHADEPTGPRLLRHLVSYLSRQQADHPLLTGYSWWVVPHANPDGEAVNRQWYSDTDRFYNLAHYLRYAERTLPGDDIEFGFPIEGKAEPLGPENAFIYDFWQSAGALFQLHVSLHSMAIAFGAWYLIDPDWVERSTGIQKQCRHRTLEMGYPLHDVDRRGEKGFHRISEGFCTRPNSEAMKAHFLERDDPETASLFHPSSMESIRSIPRPAKPGEEDGSDCLTLVSEMPLFLIPREKKDLSWPNPEYDKWLRLLGKWKMELITGSKSDEAVLQEAHHLGLRPMPVEDQIRLQWALIAAGMQEMDLGNHKI